MYQPIRILHLEDEPDFCELVEKMLEADGLAPEVTVVTNLRDFVAALKQNRFDIVLSDFRLRACTGLQALSEVRRHLPDIPFILLSGTVGEDAAVAALKCGATDYVLKQWVERLCPAVRRAFAEARERDRRKEIEMELNRREGYFRALTANSLDVLSILSADGGFLYNSASLKHILGYEPTELNGKNAFDFVHPADISGARQAFEQAMSHPELRVRHEFRFRHRDGSWCHVEVIGQNRSDNSEIGGLVINVRDIAERKRAERILIESEERYRSLFENMLGGAAYCQMQYDGDRPVDFTYLDVNGSFEALTGLKDVIGRRVTELLPGIQKSNPELFEIYGRVASGGKPERFEIYLQVLQAWHAVTAYNSKNGHFVALFENITERKRLEEGQRRLAAAVDQAAETIVITDVQGTILYVNPAFEEITGYHREEALGKNPRILKSGEHDASFYREMWHTLGRGEVWRGRITNRRKNDTLYEEDASIAPIRNEAGETVNYVAVKRDVTREIQLEDQLRQAQKMEAIGQLAGGVAHDLNNMLGVIRGNAELLLMDRDNLSDEVGQCLRHVLGASEHAANLTRQLLVFSRKQEIETQRLALNELVVNLVRMLKRVLRENIQLDCRFAPLLPPVMADPGMIEQVLLNLVVNARDAMPNGGRLVISIDQEVADETTAKTGSSGCDGKFVCLSVTDTGTGIPPEHLPRIFGFIREVCT